MNCDYECCSLSFREDRYTAALLEITEVLSSEEMCAKEKYLTIQDIVQKYDRPGGVLRVRDKY